MRQFILMFLCTLFLTSAMTQQASAQEKEERYYIATDLKNHVTSHALIRISGYQVEVFFKQTSASKPSAEWTARKVTYTSKELIKYTNSSNYAFEITFDDYCNDIMYLRNVTSNLTKRKFVLLK